MKPLRQMQTVRLVSLCIRLFKTLPKISGNIPEINHCSHFFSFLYFESFLIFQKNKLGKILSRLGYTYIFNFNGFFTMDKSLRVDVSFNPRGRASSYILQFVSWGQLCKGHQPFVSEAKITSCPNLLTCSEDALHMCLC